MMLLALMVVMFAHTTQPDPPTDSLPTFIESRQWELAVRWLDRQLAANPGDPSLRFRKAQVLAWSGEFENAIRLADLLLRDNPADSDVVLLKARIRSWQGRYAESQYLYASIPSTDPGYPEALAGLAQLHFYRGDLALALSQSELLLERYPGNETATRIVETIRRGMRPLLTTSAFFSTDSDENRVISIGDAVEWGVRADVMATASIRWVRTESRRFDLTRNATRFHAQATKGRYRAGIGAMAYAEASVAAPVFNAGYRHAGTDIYAVRYGLFDSPALADRRLMATEIGFTLTPLNRDLRLFTETSVARYGDGNTRYRLAADLSKPAHRGEWAYSMGVRGQLQFFSETSAAGYFAPAWAGLGTARVLASGPVLHPTLRVDAGADVGIQNIKPFGMDPTGVEPSYALKSTLNWRKGSWLADAGVTYSTLFNASTQAIDNRYRVWVFTLNASYRF